MRRAIFILALLPLQAFSLEGHRYNRQKYAISQAKRQNFEQESADKVLIPRKNPLDQLFDLLPPLPIPKINWSWLKGLEDKVIPKKIDIPGVPKVKKPDLSPKKHGDGSDGKDDKGQGDKGDPKNKGGSKKDKEKKKKKKKSCRRKVRRDVNAHESYHVECHDDKTTTISTTKTHLKPYTEWVDCPEIGDQACYHARSVMNRKGIAKSLTEFTCGVYKSGGRDGMVTDLWSNQHADDWYRPFPNARPGGKPDECQRDEFPPRAFLRHDKAKDRGQQWVRYLKAKPNGAVGQLYNSFCAHYSGVIDDGKPNRKELKGDKQNKVIKHKSEKGHNGDITSTVEVEVPQAIFKFKFPHLGDGDGLKDNECWPKEIVPNDPGFCLLSDDPWYDEPGNQHLKKQAESYAKDPPKDKLDKALKEAGVKSPEQGDKRKGGDTGPNKVPKKNDGGQGSSGQKKKGGAKRNIAYDGEILVENANSTRLATDEELDSIGLVRCSGAECGDIDMQLNTDGEAVYVEPREIVSPDKVPNVEADIVTAEAPAATSLVDEELLPRAAITSPDALVTGS